MTNAETRHRHANSPSSRRQRHQTTRDTPCPGHRCFDEFTSRQLGLSRPTPLASATLVVVTQTSNAGHPKPPGAYHFDSSPAARQFFFMYFPLTHSVSFFFYIFWCRYRPCGLKRTFWDGDLATVLDWPGLSTSRL